jgi:hypothetical protein
VKMIRKQVYIEQRQDSLLKRIAAKRRVTEAQVIRDALDTALVRDVSRLSVEAMREAWHEALAGRDRWLARSGNTVVQPWVREELYVDRLDRYGSHSPR